MLKRVLIVILCVILTCTGCGVEYSDLEEPTQSTSLPKTGKNSSKQNNTKITTTYHEYTVLDVRETYSTDAENNSDKCYVSLVLKDNDTGKREYYCYGPTKTDYYITIAGFVKGDVVKYYGNDKFELKTKNKDKK